MAAIQASRQALRRTMINTPRTSAFAKSYATASKSAVSPTPAQWQARYIAEGSFKLIDTLDSPSRRPSPPACPRRLTRSRSCEKSTATRSLARSLLTRSTVVPVVSSHSYGRVPSSTPRRVSASVDVPSQNARSSSPRLPVVRSLFQKVSSGSF